MQDTTLLQAVNTMLSCIGEGPVNTLDSGLPTDAVIAQSILEETSREVQSRGWWFNSIKTNLTRQANNTIQVPVNFVTIDHEDLNIVKRGSLVYDLDNATTTWTQDISDVEAVVLLDFSDLPEQVRRYVIMRASRAFFERMVGEGSRAQMLMADETQAFLSLLQYDSDMADLNIFNNEYVNIQRRRF